MKVESVSILESLIQIALSSGQKILEFYKSGVLQVASKADQSPVTAADLAAHELICNALRELTPDIPVISEESAHDTPHVIKTLSHASSFWLVDPLDGTRDFIAGTDEFTVNIALIEDNTPKLACLYAPARRDLFIAKAKDGAWRSIEGAPLSKIRTRRIDAAAPRILVSRFHKSDRDYALHGRLGQGSITPTGSALKYGLIAAGEADITLRYTPTSLWDTAAAECILHSAGGVLSTLEGKPLDYRNKSLTNPPFIASGDPDFEWRQALGIINTDTE